MIVIQLHQLIRPEITKPFCILTVLPSETYMPWGLEHHYHLRSEVMPFSPRRFVGVFVWACVCLPRCLPGRFNYGGVPHTHTHTHTTFLQVYSWGYIFEQAMRHAPLKSPIPSLGPKNRSFNRTAWKQIMSQPVAHGDRMTHPGVG